LVRDDALVDLPQRDQALLLHLPFQIQLCHSPLRKCGITFSPNRRTERSASAYGMSLKLTCSDAESTPPITRSNSCSCSTMSFGLPTKAAKWCICDSKVSARTFSIILS